MVKMVVTSVVTSIGGEFSSRDVPSNLRLRRSASDAFENDLIIFFRISVADRRFDDDIGDFRWC